MAQLPLVAPDHPDVLPSLPGANYLNGSYPTPRRSLVIRVPFDAIAEHAFFRDLRDGSIGRKVAWEMLERRRERLHVTVAMLQDRPAPTMGAPVGLRIGGPLIGTRNRGRLYLACYPERVDRGDPLAALQRECRTTPTGLYLLGIVNLVDHLTVGETANLARILRCHELATMAIIDVAAPAILSTRDDLALDATFTEFRER